MFISKQKYTELVECKEKLQQENQTYKQQVDRLINENTRLKFFLHEDGTEFSASLRIEEQQPYTISSFSITLVYYDNNYNTIEVDLGIHYTNLARIIKETDSYIHIRIGNRVYKHMKCTDTVMEVTELYVRK